MIASKLKVFVNFKVRAWLRKKMEVWNLEWAGPPGLLRAWLQPVELPGLLWRLPDCPEDISPGPLRRGKICQLSAQHWGRRRCDEEPDLPRLGFYCVIRSAGYFGWRLKRFQYHLHPSHRLPSLARSEDQGSSGSNIPSLAAPGAPVAILTSPSFVTGCSSTWPMESTRLTIPSLCRWTSFQYTKKVTKVY